MKNSFIMGVVWVSVIALVLSFCFTIFFLEGAFFAESESSFLEDADNETKISYITDESSIRTNDLAQLEKNNVFQEDEVSVNKFNAEEKEKSESGEVIESDVKIQSFFKPVQGEVIKEMATEELVYSKTLNEWTIHNGIDYKANLGQEIFSVADGKITEINFNYKYGDYIIIEHDNDYESLYANITVLDALKVGDYVEKGQIIGYLAESFGFEAADETHLHFELKNDGKYIEIIL